MTHELAITHARIVTCAGPPVRRGAAMGELAVIERGHLAIDGGRITAIETGPAPQARTRIDAQGRVLMPGLIDCHTHACWAGHRLDEWEQRLGGVPYLDILAKGGGIMSTVRSVRAASRHELVGGIVDRVRQASARGTTTLEIKSGYGLTLDAERSMLDAIRDAAAQLADLARIVPTALLGHAIDPDRPDFIEEVTNATLPAISAAFPGITIDAYCERGAWSLEAVGRLFAAAKKLGHPRRLHADQFNDLGVLAVAASLQLRSVDHLEASTPKGLASLAASWDQGPGCVGVGLPLCGVHMADGRFAPLRTLIDLGGACAVATNCNPGSAPSISMPLALAMAVRHCGLRPSEAIIAGTVNAAHVLGLDDVGRLMPGMRADLLLLRHRDERALVHDLDADHVERVIFSGRPVSTV
ncbi:MAG: imidazolonepropionase [Phycisphaerae bacterium]